MKKILTVRNEIQKTLLKCELLGQISDGMWENSRPYNHWEVWSNCEIKVGEVVGCNFWVQKDNYNFTNGDLLECIGERMVAICNMKENGCKNKIINEFNDFTPGSKVSLHIPIDSTDEEIIKAFKSNYQVIQNKKCIKEFGSFENLEKVKKGSFTMKELRKELNDLKKIFKTQIN